MQTREAPDFGGLHKNKNCAFPLSKQDKLGTDQRSIQQINFVGNIPADTRVITGIEKFKEKILEFS